MVLLGDTKVNNPASGGHGKELRFKVALETAVSGRIELKTAIPQGQGHTFVILNIGPEDFRALADAMIEANRNAALAALSAAVAVRLTEEEGAAPPSSLTEGSPTP